MVAVLLVPVCHQDKVSVVQGAVVMQNEGVVEKESDVSSTDDFGATVLPLGNFGVLAQPHCEEERDNRQLCNS